MIVEFLAIDRLVITPESVVEEIALRHWREMFMQNAAVLHLNVPSNSGEAAPQVNLEEAVDAEYSDEG